MSQKLTISEICQIILKGEEKSVNVAITQLYHSYREKVAATVFKQGGNYDDGKEIFQEVIEIFIDKVRSRKFEFRSESELTGYMTETAKNQWLKRLRSGRNRKNREETYALTEQKKNEEPDAISDEVRSKLQKALDKLDAECRQMIQDFYTEELSIKEIADLLGISPANVKVKKHRCLLKLKNIYFSKS